MDLKLTTDGDLALGQQSVDEYGNPLYYTPNQTEFPGITTTTPIEGCTPLRDADTVFSTDEKAQWVNSILKTDAPDWSLYPKLGANLSDLIGELNNAETGAKACTMIREALVLSGGLKDEELEVECIPVSVEKILFKIKLQRQNSLAYDLYFSWDYELGMLNYYEKEGRILK